MRVVKTIVIISILVLCLMVLCFSIFNRSQTANKTKPTNSSLVDEPTIPTYTEPTIPEETTPPQEVKHYNIDNNKKYVGVYINDPQELNIFEDSISLLGWFDTFDKPSLTKISMCLDEHEYVAFITLEPNDMDLKQIESGCYDDRIINYFTMLSEGDRVYTELFIRFAHEMEMRPTYKNPWYHWQGHDSEAYVNAWRHVIDLGRQYAPNVKWVWSPNRADSYTKAYYPGDEYVDYVGLTLNNTVKSYETFEDFYVKQGKLEYLEAYNKPIIFGEVAEHCLDDNQKNSYMASMFEYIKKYDKAIGMVFLNKDVESKRQYKFSDNAEQLKTFIENAKDLRLYEKQN